MSKAFEINPDRIDRSVLYGIDAARTRTIPGVQCPNCGVWAATGVIYPYADIAAIDNVVALGKPWPIPLNEFEALVAKLQSVLGTNRPIRPGTDIGPLRGKARGTFGDFAWQNPWTPLIRESIWFEARKADLGLIAVPADLDFGAKPHEALLELEALPKVRLQIPKPVDECKICGRSSVKKPERLAIIGNTFDDSIPLQRIADFTTILVVNEKFAQFIQDRALTDVVLSPIEVL